jgi:hypothetical protein
MGSVVSAPRHWKGMAGDHRKQKRQTDQRQKEWVGVGGRWSDVGVMVVVMVGWGVHCHARAKSHRARVSSYA